MILTGLIVREYTEYYVVFHCIRRDEIVIKPIARREKGY